MATKPELVWAVKDSLISYIESLDDGKVETVEPATRAQSGFRFPGQEVADGDHGDGTLQFFGVVRLTGYWGALDIELRDPMITFDGERGTLLVRERGVLDPNRFLPFADLVFDNQMVDISAGSGFEAAASLTGQGQLLLGGQYQVGQALSPVRISIPHRDE